GHRLGRLSADLDPVSPALFVHLELRRLEVRVIRPDRLDELAVARRAAVGGNDVVVRHLLCAGAGEAKNDRHGSVCSVRLEQGPIHEAPCEYQRNPPPSLPFPSTQAWLMRAVLKANPMRPRASTRIRPPFPPALGSSATAASAAAFGCSPAR